jgi:hypothetical protein
VAFLGSNDVVYVIEAGTTAWRSLTLQGRASTDLTSAGDAWFVGMADGSVVCIEADGSLRWRSFAAPPVDAVRATASGACVVLAGPRLIRLDKQTGVPTHRHELAGLPLLPLLDEAADDGLRLWIVCGKEARSVDLETLDIGKTLPFDVANPRQFAHLPRGFAIATPSGVTVLDAKGRPWWSLTSDRKPFVHASNGAWIGVLDDRGRVYAFSSLP